MHFVFDKYQKLR